MGERAMEGILRSRPSFEQLGLLDPPLGLGPDPHELVRRVGQNVSHKTFNLAAENNDAQILPTPDRRGE